MKHLILATCFGLIAFCLPASAQAQTASRGTDAEITFPEQENKEEARQQLKRLLSEYDLDPWIVTQEVQIEANVDPHSSPILTLNARHLDDDETQLSIFLHEQAHLLPEGKREAAAQDLRELFPEIPGLPTDMSQIPEEGRKQIEEFKQSTYNHIAVAWVELDAMTELVGEQEARQIMRGKMQMLTDEPYSTLEKSFRWYNTQVLEHPREIGSVLADHDLVITPESGLPVTTGS